MILTIPCQVIITNLRGLSNSPTAEEASEAFSLGTQHACKSNSENNIKDHRSYYVPVVLNACSDKQNCASELDYTFLMLCLCYVMVAAISPFLLQYLRNYRYKMRPSQIALHAKIVY